MRDHSQHLSAVVDTVSNVFHDCLSNYKVPAVDTVVDSLSLQHRSEVVSYPVVVERAEANKHVILEVL